MTTVRSTIALATSWRESAAEPRPPENKTTLSRAGADRSPALTDDTRPLCHRWPGGEHGAAAAALIF